MRNRYMWFVFGLCVGMTPCAQSQNIGLVTKPVSGMWVKSENSTIIAFHRRATDRDSSTVQIFDEKGNPQLNVVDLLRLVPDASEMSIHDVSVQPGQMVAVSATYVKSREVLPADVLLLFDWNGTLRSASALSPSREIVALAIDEHLSTWTVAWDVGEGNPAEEPLVVVYGRNGEVLKQLLKRIDFPPHEDSIEQGPEIGSVECGYASGVFWFWLPRSTDLFLINSQTGATLGRFQTNLPDVRDNTVWPLKIVRESSGDVIAEVRVAPPTPKSKGRVEHYAWSPDSRSWASFDPSSACPDDRLVGLSGSKQIYMRFGPTPPLGSICSYSRR